MKPAALGRLLDTLREEWPNEHGDFVAVCFRSGQKDCGTKHASFSEWVLEIAIWVYFTSGMPGWSDGRDPGAGQKNVRSVSPIATSLMLASRRRIRPRSSNSQSSLP